MSLYTQVEALTPEEIVFLTNVLEKSIEKSVLFIRQMKSIEDVIGKVSTKEELDNFTKEFNMMNDIYSKFKVIKEVVQ
jgi:hypothetical protein